MANKQLINAGAVVGFLFGAGGAKTKAPAFTRDEFLKECTVREPLSDCMARWDGR